jgi:hypothetical protein
MMDKLIAFLGIHRTGMVFGIASNIIKAFEGEFQKDHDSKNAAIDCIVQILLSYKDSVTAAPVAPPAVPVANQNS